jgi:hypothetical protein
MASPHGLPTHRMLVLLFAVIASSKLGLNASGQSSPASSQQRVPVLVELFTSEGCSDCPPADALLAKLDANQPVPGAQAIVLSEHVTYWNHLGWRDPFSLGAMTQRQEDYDRRFGLDSSYTPQIVVDGTTQFVGSDSRALVMALTKASQTPKQSLSIENARLDHGMMRFSVRGAGLKDAKLIAVLATDATGSEVARGENAGRTLHHTAVVRVMTELSSDSTDGRPLNLSGGSSASGSLRLVVFLTDRNSGHVIGAAEQILR